MTETPPPAEPRRPDPGRAIRTFFGVLLMLVGAIIALATGLCVWILGGNSLGGVSDDPMRQYLGAMGIGAVPFLIGVALIVGGWFLSGFGRRKGGS